MKLSQKHVDLLVDEIINAKDELDFFDDKIEAKGYNDNSEKLVLQIKREILWNKVKFLRKSLKKLDVYIS